MKRVLVFLNGDYGERSFYANHITEEDHIICADGAFGFLAGMKVLPNLLVGDMDSFNKKYMDQKQKMNLRCFPKEKDFSDGEAALDAAVELNPEQILIFGAMGYRKDHEYTNVALLEKYIDHNITLLDETTAIFLAKEKAVLNEEEGTLVSLLPVTETVEGITTKGLKYPLNNETLYRASSRGLSNIVTENPAEIEFEKGIIKIIITYES